jgi:hypothetical protein
MGLIFETRTLGISVKVFSERLEYKRGLGAGVDSIPIAQIASIKLGSWLINRLTIETTGGREYAIVTNKKQAVADAIHQAQIALQSISSMQQISVADEIVKLAQLRDQGILSPQDFELQKSGLIGRYGMSPAPSVALADAGHVIHPKAVRRPGSPFVRTVKLVVLTIFALLVALLILGIVVGPTTRTNGSGRATPSHEVIQSANTDEVIPESPEKHLLTEDEKEYFGAVLGYLKAVSDTDIRMTKVMAAGETGGFALDDIKEEIESARLIQDASYSGSYRSVHVPSGLATLDKKIQRSKSLHDAAFREMLAYFDDESDAHIKNGGSMLKQAVLAANECINDANATMTGIADKRRKANRSKTLKH